MCSFVLYQGDENPRKKGRPRRVAMCLDDRYPVISSESSIEEAETALEALHKEMSNAKPRRDIFLPLMKTTFSLRRHYVMHDALSVQDILREYPAMKQANAVCVSNIDTPLTVNFFFFQIGRGGWERGRERGKGRREGGGEGGEGRG